MSDKCIDVSQMGTHWFQDDHGRRGDQAVAPAPIPWIERFKSDVWTVCRDRGGC